MGKGFLFGSLAAIGPGDQYGFCDIIGFRTSSSSLAGGCIPFLQQKNEEEATVSHTYNAGEMQIRGDGQKKNSIRLALSCSSVTACSRLMPLLLRPGFHAQVHLVEQMKGVENLLL
ncbi:unnamed protein product [Natator depressus]